MSQLLTDLRESRRLLVEQGWCKRYLEIERDGQNSFCVDGAIGKACQLQLPRAEVDAGGYKAFAGSGAYYFCLRRYARSGAVVKAVVEVLNRTRPAGWQPYNGVSDAERLYRWNDHSLTKKEDVVEALDQAICVEETRLGLRETTDADQPAA